MGYRDFTDAAGVQWQAWDVVPRLSERRSGANRRVTPPSTDIIDRRVGGDRRMAESARRASLSDGLSKGWLCFESRVEKRRLTPIPADWQECEVAQLERYCRDASPVRRPGYLDDDDEAGIELSP